MRRLGDQRGFTLIELLVSMVLTMVVMTAVVMILTVFLNDSRYDGLRDNAQDDSRALVDQLSHDLRNATSKKPDATGLIQQAGDYDIVFQSVIGDGSPQNYNTYDQQWVRYCLDSNKTVWRQTAPVDTSSAASSATPDTGACPSTSTRWTTSTKMATDVTNEVNPSTASPTPLFKYNSTTFSSIREVVVTILTDLNPGHLPGPSPQLTSGIYLRNDVSPPTAGITVTQTPNSNDTQSDVVLNGSSSSDPQGQSLTYQWYANSGTTDACPADGGAPTTGELVNGTTEIYDAGPYQSTKPWVFSLVVTDTGGLTKCQSYPVTIS